jgi:hypothetical protein
MTFPIYGRIKNVPNHQSAIIRWVYFLKKENYD